MPTYNAGGGNIPGYPAPNPLITPPKKPIDIYLVVLVIVSVFLMGVLGFGFWAYGGMQDYKKNSDKKVATAVELAKQETSTQKDKEFVEKEKIPHKSYKAPSTLASVQFEYPKTWAAFITENESTNQGTPLDGYIHPDYVHGTQSGTDVALRIQVVSKPYSDMLSQYEGKIKQGKLKIAPYKAPKVSDVLGVRIEGEINKNQKDVMIMLPIRDKTLVVWTESSQFVPDFDNIVLASLKFDK